MSLAISVLLVATVGILGVGVGVEAIPINHLSRGSRKILKSLPKVSWSLDFVPPPWMETVESDGNASMFIFEDVSKENYDSLFDGDERFDANREEEDPEAKLHMTDFPHEFQIFIEHVLNRPIDSKTPNRCMCKLILRKCVNCPGARILATVFTCVRNRGRLHWWSHQHIAPNIVPSNLRRDPKIVAKPRPELLQRPTSFAVVLPFGCEMKALDIFMDRFPRVNFDVRLFLTYYPSRGSAWMPADDFHKAVSLRTGLIDANVVVLEKAGEYSESSALASLLAAVDDGDIVIAVNLYTELRAAFFLNAQAFVAKQATVAYFPVVWQTYDPVHIRTGRSFLEETRLHDNQMPTFSSERGSWRTYGSDVFAMIGSDAKTFAAEDPSLFEKKIRAASTTDSVIRYVLDRKRHVVRLRDPHILIRWHPLRCSEDDGDTQSAAKTLLRSSCLYARAVSAGSKLELYLRLSGSEKQKPALAHNNETKYIDIVKSRVDSALDSLHSRSSWNAGSTELKDSLDSLLAVIRKYDVQRLDDATKSANDGFVVREKLSRTDAPAQSAKGVLLFPCSVASLTETVRRASFYESCGLDTVVVFSATACDRDPTCDRDAIASSGAIVESVDADEEPQRRFVFSILSWLSTRRSFLDAYDAVVLMSADTFLDPLRFDLWLDRVITSGIIYGGAQLKRNRPSDPESVDVYCDASRPIVFSTRRLLHRMQAKGWKICNDFLSDNAAWPTDVAIGRCVAENFDVGCDEHPHINRDHEIGSYLVSFVRDGLRLPQSIEASDANVDEYRSYIKNANEERRKLHLLGPSGLRSAVAFPHLGDPEKFWGVADEFSDVCTIPPKSDASSPKDRTEGESESDDDYVATQGDDFLTAAMQQLTGDSPRNAYESLVNTVSGGWA